MSYRLAEILSSFSWLAHVAALAVFGLACRRYRKAGGDQAFGIAAWLTLAYLLLIAIPYTIDSARDFLGGNRGWRMPWLDLVLFRCREASEWFDFAQFALFSAGVIRTARRLPRKVTVGTPKSDEPVAEG